MNRDIDARLAALGLHRSEVEERFILGSGPGGQKVNKTSSTVALRHRPTGTQARSQDQRSQSANRERAWLDLCGKLEAASKARADALIDGRQRARRRSRQKSRGQKARMIQAKRLRTRKKVGRARVGADG